MKNIVIIGLGHHAKRIYLRGLQRLNLQPKLIIDLESKKEDILKCLSSRNISCETFFIPDEHCNHLSLAKEIEKQIDSIFSKLFITHAIISTEPKAHYSYLKYLIKNKIPVLTDKPITAPSDVTNINTQALKIHEEYVELLSLQKRYQTPVVVQCQRRYDRRYRYISNLIKTTTLEYGIPVSHIEINHCDGNWNMPDEFFSRENHPYKYGYGKIFHSGYHFIDLLSVLLHLEEQPEVKRPTCCQVMSSHYAPQDQLFSLDDQFYSRVFKDCSYKEYFERWSNNEYSQMGELDILLNYELSRSNHVMTTCSLNLLQSGFSRRAWAKLPQDTYKGNGRVRHESVNIQIGPLMNIQIHSYQAHEVKERKNKTISHTATGGLEHYDIHVFRNSELIGGKPHEQIQGTDIMSDEHNEDTFIGYNERARDECLYEFLEGIPTSSTLEAQSFTIDLVTHAYLSVCRKRTGQPPISKFPINLNERVEEHDSTEFCSRIRCI